jgi:hypothetical protein
MRWSWLKRQQNYRRKFRHIARRLRTFELQRDEQADINLSEGDLLADLHFDGQHTRQSTPRFLGFYSKTGIEHALRRFGFYAELKKRGFSETQLVLATTDPFRQRLAIYDRNIDRDHLLAELICRIDYFKPREMAPELALPMQEQRVLYLEWLNLQNPRAKFSKEKPPLPGQRFPGLGLGRPVFEILALMARRLQCAALLNVPERYHNAALYSNDFFFIKAQDEALMQVIERDLRPHHSLAEISQGFDQGLIANLDNGEKIPWIQGRQISPLKNEIMRAFTTPDYKLKVGQELRQLSLVMLERS